MPSMPVFPFDIFHFFSLTVRQEVTSVRSVHASAVVKCAPFGYKARSSEVLQVIRLGLEVRVLVNQRAQTRVQRLYGVQQQ